MLVRIVKYRKNIKEEVLYWNNCLTPLEVFDKGKELFGNKVSYIENNMRQVVGWEFKNNNGKVTEVYPLEEYKEIKEYKYYLNGEKDTLILKNMKNY